MHRKILCAPMIILHAGDELRSAFAESLTVTERWGWIALRMLVSESPFRPVLCVGPGIPFTDEQISNQLMIGEDSWKKLKRKLVDTGRIELDPRLGITVPHWNRSPASRFYRQKPRAALPMHYTEEELRQDRAERVELASIFMALTGRPAFADNYQFVQKFRERKAEGATKEDFEIAMRTYCNYASQFSIMVTRRLNPVFALAAGQFWKFRKANKPIYGRTISTIEYIKGLPDGKREGARRVAVEYTKSIQLTMRRNGWASLADIDFSQIPTCKQYLMERVDSIPVVKRGDKKGG